MYIEMRLLLVTILADVTNLKPLTYCEVRSLSEDMVILFIPPLIKGKTNLLVIWEEPSKPIMLMDPLLEYSLKLS